MNESEYLMKNYGDRGGCHPSRPQAEADNTLRDLHNSSYDTKAEFNNCLTIQNNSEFKNIAKTSLPASTLSLSLIVYVQVCPAPQIFSKQQMSPSELSSCCFCYVFSHYFAQFQLQFLLLKRVKRPPFQFLQRKQLNLVPRSSRLTVH